MNSKPIAALGTIELFTNPGDTIHDVKIKLLQDVVSDDSELTEYVQNLQFGVFYDFLSAEQALAERGRIFRAGMRYGQQFIPMGPPPRGGNEPTRPIKPDYLSDLEQLFKKGKDEPEEDNDESI